MLAALVQPEVIPALHVEDIQILKPIVVDVERGRVATPALVDEAGRPGDISEAIAALIPVQDARLGALRMEMSHERVTQSDEVSTRATLVGGIHADVGHEQIEFSVVVVIEENGARGMSGVSHPGRLGDVAEATAANVLKEMIAVAHCRYEQIGIAVVVDVSERAADRDRVRHLQPGRFCDVSEPATALILPQLVGAELRDEVQIGQSVAIDVGRANTGAVIVVDELVSLARIVDHPVLEVDSALAHTISEPKVVQDSGRRRQLLLLGGPGLYPRRERRSRHAIAWRRARISRGLRSTGDEQRERCYETATANRQDR